MSSELKYRSLGELVGFMGWFIILAFDNAFMKDLVWLFLSPEMKKNMSTLLQLLQVWPSVHLLEIPPDSKTMWALETSLAIKKTNEFSRTAAGVAALKRITKFYTRTDEPKIM